jgi:hypothetical protein
MTLFKFVRDDVTKFSFVTRTTFKNGIFYIYYLDKNEEERYKALPYRATRDQLITALESIKQESDYFERKKKEHMIIRQTTNNNPAIAGYIKGEKNG